MAFKDNPIGFLTTKLWEYSKENRPNVILYFSLFIIANTIGLIEPLIVGKVLNIIQEQGVNVTNLPTLIMYLSIFLILSLSFWIFHGPARIIERNNSFLVRANYKKFLLDGTMSLPAEWHANHHSGDTIDKIEKSTDALFQYSERTFEVIENLVRFIGSYLALAYFNLHASYIVLLMVIITITLILKFDKLLIRQYSELYRAENGISAKVYDVISNIATVIILRVEKLVSSVIFKKIMHPFELFRKNTKLNEVKWFIVSLSSALMVFLVLSSYLYFNIKSGTTILVGTIYILYGYLQEINSLFFRFAYRYGDIVKQQTAVLNIKDIEQKFMKKETRTSILTPNWKELKIKSLEFSYHPKEETELHLDNISFSIKRNQRIALIGDSGSGKTTLLKIIRDLYHLRRGKVLLDNELLKSGFKSISPSIALIPQDPEIFSTTIKENITLGIYHPIKEVKKFTNMACFTNVVNRLPHKFNSSIEEKGVNLSGGEKQRLALARGLMACKNKQIILLDEPTSSVDIKTELLIYQNIFKQFKNKTILSSIHRLHLLHLFDKIYFFNNGKIIASGTFKELLKNSSEFKKIWGKYKHIK